MKKFLNIIKNKFINDKNLKRLFVFFFCILIFFHGAYYTILQRHKKQMVGTDKKIDVVLNFENFLSTKYQNDLEAFIKNKGVVAKYFKILSNFYMFKIFSSTNAGVLIGKNNEIFEEVYLFEKFALNKEDEVGVNVHIKRKDAEFANNYAKKVKKAQDLLKKNGIELVFIFAPTKADFMEETIPAKFNCLLTEERESKRNYVQLKKAMEENGVYFIDANEYFLNNKNKTEYPLFTKYGIHWSNFGFYSFAKDEIFKNVLKNDLTCEVYSQKTPIGSDADMGYKIEIKSKKLKYRELGYIRNCKLSRQNDKNILLIGDSFNDLFVNNKDFQKFFEDETGHFAWRHYEAFFDFKGDRYKRLLEISTSERMDILKKKDVVFIIQTTPNVLRGHYIQFFDDVLNNFN